MNSLHTTQSRYNILTNYRKDEAVFKVVYLCASVMTYEHGEVPVCGMFFEDEVGCLIAGANLHPTFITNFKCMPGELRSPWPGFVEESPLPTPRSTGTVVE